MTATWRLEARLQELKGLEFIWERHDLAQRTFVFRHALTREVAYDGMLRVAPPAATWAGRQRCWSTPRAASAFEHAELLAFHYSRSSEPARAIPPLTVAGDRARDRYANEEAIALYRQATGLIEELDGGRRPDAYAAHLPEPGRGPVPAQPV